MTLKLTTVIGISGTHCTGKTTMCNLLVDYYRSKGYTVTIISEVVRDCPYPVNENGSLESQEWIFNEQLRRLNEHYGTVDIIITDRTFLDSAAYLYYTNGYTELSSEFEYKCQAHTLLWYSTIYLTTLLEDVNDGSPEEDGFRSTDAGFRKAIHKTIYDLYSELIDRSGSPVIYQVHCFEEIINIIEKQIGGD